MPKYEVDRTGKNQLVNWRDLIGIDLEKRTLNGMPISEQDCKILGAVQIHIGRTGFGVIEGWRKTSSISIHTVKRVLEDKTGHIFL